MSVLSDRDIHKEIVVNKQPLVNPYERSELQPASIDIKCSGEFLVFKNGSVPFIDVRKPNPELTERAQATERRPFILHPGEFVLGSTYETISLPDYMVARLEGKSSLGRLGLVIHSTAGFIDPGFTGTITLELSNNATLPITLYPKMKIGQVSFMYLSSPAERPYGSPGLGSKYQHQSLPEGSQMHKNFEDNK